jgi:hypothetical protein
MAELRPTAPILEGDLKEPKTFYHNAAYKTNRVAINLEKMKVSFEEDERARREARRPGRSRAQRVRASRCCCSVAVLLRCRFGPAQTPPSPSTHRSQMLKERLADCVRQEGVNYIEKCEQVSAGASAFDGYRVVRCLPPTAGALNESKHPSDRGAAETGQRAAAGSNPRPAASPPAVSTPPTHPLNTPPPSPQPQKKLTKRYEAIVRVCQWQAGDKQRPRNTAGILDKEKEIKAQLRAEGAAA